ncbi:MAG: DUF502 domain-containing protein [Limnochordaceae bacterium]|nr:DUF502 domain-containing protein [Limnochordaceae bacterium]
MGKRSLRRLRNVFITGLVLSLPAIVTAYLLWAGFTWADGLVGRLIRWFLGYSVPGLGLVLFVGLIFGVGVVGRNYLGGKILGWLDDQLQHIPLVRSIYGTVRQFLDSFVLGNTGAFREVVLVEYPRLGVYSLGFVTGEGLGDVGPTLGAPSDGQREGNTLNPSEAMTRVFVPTTPNPTSGFLLVLPAKDVIRLPISVEWGMRIIVSGGVLWPETGAGGSTAREVSVSATVHNQQPRNP